MKYTSVGSPLLAHLISQGQNPALTASPQGEACFPSSQTCYFSKNPVSIHRKPVTSPGKTLLFVCKSIILQQEITVSPVLLNLDEQLEIDPVSEQALDL